MNSKDNKVESRFSFSVALTTDELDGGFTVTFPDLPEAITQGENIQDALIEATDCLEEAIANRIVRRLEIPIPSKPAKDAYMVTTPMQTSLKASIWLTMQEKNLNQNQVAKIFNVDEKEIRRILDPSHNTKLEALERLRSAACGIATCFRQTSNFICSVSSIKIAIDYWKIYLRRSLYKHSNLKSDRPLSIVHFQLSINHSLLLT